jgi:hypothetical protein
MQIRVMLTPLAIVGKHLFSCVLILDSQILGYSIFGTRYSNLLFGICYLDFGICFLLFGFCLFDT